MATRKGKARDALLSHGLGEYLGILLWSLAKYLLFTMTIHDLQMALEDT